jgi:hypothetical protein
MGHQQYLLAILGGVLVAIAIFVAATMFHSNAIESSRSALTNDLLYLANRARAAYWRPALLGGADRDFNRVTYRSISSMSQNPNGRYFIESSSTAEIVLVGVGRVTSNDDSVRVRMHVDERHNTVEVVN